MNPRPGKYRKSQREVRKLNILCGILLTLYLAFLSPKSTAFARGQNQPKRVLILYSFENDVGLYSDFDESLRAKLRSGGAGRIEFYTEFLDLARFPSPEHEKELVDDIRVKYSKANLSLIFPVSLPAINFTRSHGEELFPGIATIFCAVDRRWILRLPLPSNSTGIMETTKISKTLEAALQVQPDTRRVVVVGGVLPYERDWMKEIQSDLREYEGKLDFTYLTDLPMDELLQQLANLPEHTIVLYMMLWQDGAGENFLPKEALLRMAQASNAPIYGVFEGFLGTGIVGGNMIQFKAAGTMAALMGLHLLNGEKPAEVPVLSEDIASYVFDWRQLRRWHISEHRLPPGSVVLYRQPSAWELYRWRIIEVVLLIITEAILIVLLLLQRRRRRRAEEALRASEKRYRDLVESSHDWVWEVNAEGVYTYAGSQCRELLGYEPKELMGKTPFDLMPTEEAQRVRLAFTEIATQHLPFRHLENTSLRTDGRLVVLETNGVPIFDEQSRFCGYRGMDRDITQRKQAEDHLRESEKKYRELHEGLMDGYVRVEMTGKIAEFNDAFQKLIGYEPQELFKLTYLELTPDKWHAFEADIIERQILVQGHSDVYEKEYRRKDGTMIPVELRTHLMRDEAGNPCGMWAIVRDITERKQAEEALRKAETDYRNIFEEALEGIYRTSPEGKNLAANPALARILGYDSAEEVLAVVHDSGSQVWVDPDERAAYVKLLEERAIVRGFECRFRRKDGKVIWVALNTRRVGGPDGKTFYYEGFLEDITERKWSEEALRQRNKYIETVLGEAPIGFAVHTISDGVGRFVSARFEEIYGVPRGTIDSHHTFFDKVWPYDPVLREEIRHRVLTDIATGDSARMHWEKIPIQTPTGRTRYITATNIPLPDQNLVVSTVQDVTESVRADEALRRQSVFNSLMVEIHKRFSTCPPEEVDAVVENVLEATAKFIGADHAYIVRLSEDRTSWSATHEWCAPNVTPMLQQFQSIPRGTVPMTEEKLLKGEAVRINSPDDYPVECVAERRHQEREGHLSALNVPIMTEVGLFGNIGLHCHARPLAWSDELLAHLQMVGDVVATALERKQMLEELQKSEKKFSMAFHGSPSAMAICSVATGRYIDVNRTYELHTGFSTSEIIGHTPRELGIYVQPLDAERISEALAGRARVHDLEMQFRSKTGDLRVALLSTEAIEVGGEPCMLIVSEDITDRKRIEEASREIGSRMVMVQEEERRRVARELHDDFSQRLALLAIDLEQLGQQPPATKQEWGPRIRSMWAQTQELTSDVHRLSYQLHPSKLEDLGLVLALRSYCHSLAKQTGIDVKFSDANIPQFLSKEISLCIYRVVQEAMRNVVKHSGAKSAAVVLSGAPNEIHLMISDSGKGFDWGDVRSGEGLGLVSMQERVRYVGGKWSIDARPSGGTRVVVRIPVPSQQNSGDVIVSQEATG